MKLEDLTQWDFDMMKSHAKDALLDTNSEVSKAWVTSVLYAIHAMGYDIVKNDTRKPTWISGPKKSWYVQEVKKSRSK